MSPRAALDVRIGDRCVALDQLAEVVDVFAAEHALHGGVRVRFVRRPWITAIVRIAALHVVGFGETARAPEVTS